MVKKRNPSLDSEHLINLFKSLATYPQSSNLGDSFPQEVEPPRWLTGRDLIKIWGIRNFELFDLMKKGLQAYNPQGKKIINSARLERAPQYTLDQMEAFVQGAGGTYRVLGRPARFQRPPTEREIKEEANKAYKAQSLEIVNPPKDCELMSFEIPQDKNMADQMLLMGMSFLYKTEDVLNFPKEQKGPVEPASQEPHHGNIEESFPEPQINRLTEIAIDLKEYNNAFCRIGENWFIKFNEKHTTLQDNKYIRYIPYLLERPGEEIHVNDLYNLVTGKNVDSIFSVEGHEYEFSSSDLRIDVLSQEELNKLKETGDKLLSNFNMAKERGDIEQIRDAEEELKNYRNYLLNEFGIFTKVSQDKFCCTKTKPRPSPEIEKARKNVSIQIDKALKKIGEELPELCQYLKSHIKRGRFCSYKPDPQKPIEWLIEYS